MDFQATSLMGDIDVLPPAGKGIEIANRVKCLSGRPHECILDVRPERYRLEMVFRFYLVETLLFVADDL
jgi:hypothetical protein